MWRVVMAAMFLALIGGGIYYVDRQFARANEADRVVAAVRRKAQVESANARAVLTAEQEKAAIGESLKGALEALAQKPKVIHIEKVVQGEAQVCDWQTPLPPLQSSG